MTADQSPRRALHDLLAQTVSGTTQDSLLRAALIVSHGAAVSTLGHPQFSWEDAIWGKPYDLSRSLIAIYDDPEALRLLGLFQKLWLQAEGVSFSGIDNSMPGPKRWPEADTFPLNTMQGCVIHPLRGQTTAEAQLVNIVLNQLIRCARDWLDAHPLSDGLEQPAGHGVIRSAGFARLFLDAVARASPGESLFLPDVTAGPSGQGTPAAAFCETGQHLRRLLPHHLEFSLLSNRDKQALSELLLLMPIFLAAMYEYGRLAAEHDSQEMASELANQYRHEFFGLAPYRTHFNSFSMLPICHEVAYPPLDWWELQDGQRIPSPLDFMAGGEEDGSESIFNS